MRIIIDLPDWVSDQEIKIGVMNTTQKVTIKNG